MDRVVVTDTKTDCPETKSTGLLVLKKTEKGVCMSRRKVAELPAFLRQPVHSEDNVLITTDSKSSCPGNGPILHMATKIQQVRAIEKLDLPKEIEFVLPDDEDNEDPGQWEWKCELVLDTNLELVQTVKVFRTIAATFANVSATVTWPAGEDTGTFQFIPANQGPTTRQPVVNEHAYDITYTILNP
eukprot:TRINITY_DN69435_c0_g1_i1.p1 TRINITY_DN69435_c0_g1~~TRINITY_DN69435_c0_g1_i1.p1  ORF type:complete len:186 (-),score=14.49 TRINITY_DN69435_c0_g1_i1:54-611(-)